MEKVLVPLADYFNYIISHVMSEIIGQCNKHFFINNKALLT